MVSCSSSSRCDRSLRRRLSSSSSGIVGRIVVLVLCVSTLSSTTTAKRLRGRPGVGTHNTNSPHDEAELVKLRGSRSVTLDVTGFEQQQQHYNNPLIRNPNNRTQDDDDHDSTQLLLDLIDQYQHTQVQNKDEQTPPTTRNPRRHEDTVPVLPLGAEHYNHSLFEELHNAPFELYEATLDDEEERVEREPSFPVFIVPDWPRETAAATAGGTTFAAFSRTAQPLKFENLQTLLTWEEIVAASSGAGTDAPLVEFMDDCDFAATLFIGKLLRNGRDSDDSRSRRVEEEQLPPPVPFLGVLVSYQQRQSRKNILIPFAKIDHFFHDTSEEYLLHPTTVQLEHAALHNMLDAARSSASSSLSASTITNTNTTTLRSPPTPPPPETTNELVDASAAVHYRRLFQLLIRRTFLFSYGYADCLQVEPETLRECLDDTFRLVVQMEASVREALDHVYLAELQAATLAAAATTAPTRTTTSTTGSSLSSPRRQVREACISVSSLSWSGMDDECGGASSSSSSAAAFTGLTRTFR